MPIPEEQGHRKSGMRIRPGRIKIHIDGKRTRPPDRKGGKKSPEIAGILAGYAKGEEETEKSPEGGAASHGNAIGLGETIGGNLRAQRPGQQHTALRKQQEGS